MLEIDKNGNIKINRGDTFEIPLFIDIGESIFKSTRFAIRDGDIITFRLFESNAPKCCSLIEKECTVKDINENGDIILKFDHSDTGLFPAIYYYEIKLERPVEEAESAFVTIVPRRKFVIQ